MSFLVWKLVAFHPSKTLSISTIITIRQFYLRIKLYLRQLHIRNEVSNRGKKMKTRRIWGIVCIIVGAVMLFFSHHTSKQVVEGKTQIRQGKQAIKSSESVFGMSKYTKTDWSDFNEFRPKELAAGTRYCKIHRNVQKS